jgi:hypothetical protein
MGLFANLKPCIPERQTRNSFLQGNALSHNDLKPESFVAPVGGFWKHKNRAKENQYMKTNIASHYRTHRTHRLPSGEWMVTSRHLPTGEFFCGIGLTKASAKREARLPEHRRAGDFVPPSVNRGQFWGII